MISRYTESVHNELSYDEFLQLILPYHQYLRFSSVKKLTYDVPVNSRLNFTFEDLLVKVITKEIEINHGLEKYKNALKQRYDFDLFTIFQMLDKRHDNYINEINLGRFLTERGYEDESEWFVRKLDIDMDGKLSYNEFERGVLPSYSEIETQPTDIKDYAKSRSEFKYRDYVPLSEQKQRTKMIPTQKTTPYKLHKGDNFSTSKFSMETTYASPYSDENKTQKRIGSIIKRTNNYSHRKNDKYADEFSFDKPSEYIRSEPKRISDLYGKNITKEIPERYIKNIKESSGEVPKIYVAKYKDIPETYIKRHTEESERYAKKTNEVEKIPEVSVMNLAEAIKRQILIEKELEEHKVNLALQSDFNLIDVFRLFDSEGKCYVTFEEFENALKKLGLTSSPRQLFERYNQSKCDRLDYVDFCDMVLPKDTNYTCIINKRHPSKEEISAKTIEFLMILIKKSIELEDAGEDIRRELKSNPEFNTSDAFNTFDTEGKGTLTLNEVLSILIA